MHGRGVDLREQPAVRDDFIGQEPEVGGHGEGDRQARKDRVEMRGDGRYASGPRPERNRVAHGGGRKLWPRRERAVFSTIRRMNKRALVEQLVERLRAAARTARRISEEATQEAREGATAAERRENTRVALENSGHMKLSRTASNWASP